MPKFMKGKMELYLAIALLVVVIMGVRFFQSRKEENGSTLESRKILLEKVEDDTRIVEETRIKDYIISGFIGQNNTYGIAVFQPKGEKGYKLQSTYTKDQGEILTEHLLIGESYYDIFWFEQADLGYAEVTYTDNAKGETMEPIRLDAKAYDILYYETPVDDCAVKVVFYDINGNMYE